MKKVISILIAIALFASLFTLVASAEDLFYCSLDTITGTVSKSATGNGYVNAAAKIQVGTTEEFTLIGWAVTEPGIDKLQYNVNGGAWKDASSSHQSRPDVYNHCRDKLSFNVDETANAKAGFTAQLTDIKDLAVGEYTVIIRVVNNGSSTIEIATIALSVVADLSIPDKTVIEKDALAKDIAYFTDRGGDPKSFKGASFAVQFAIPEGKAASQFYYFQSPTWGSHPYGADCYATIYKWNKDYDTTVAGRVLGKLQIYGHGDGEDLIIDFGKIYSSGEYLLVCEGNGTENIGTWAATANANYTTTTYINGKVREYIPAFVACVYDVRDYDANTDIEYFDEISVNGTKVDNGQSTPCKAPDARTIDGTDGSVETIGFNGWFGSKEDNVLRFGYQIDNRNFIFTGATTSEEAGVTQAGGEFRVKYTIDVTGLKDGKEHKIRAVAQLKNGTIVYLYRLTNADGSAYDRAMYAIYKAPAAKVLDGESDIYTAIDNRPLVWIDASHGLTKSVSFKAAKGFNAITLPASWGSNGDFTLTVSVEKLGHVLLTKDVVLNTNPGPITIDLGETIFANDEEVTISFTIEQSKYFVFAQATAYADALTYSDSSEGAFAFGLNFTDDPVPVVPVTADASLVIFVLAACAIALVVLKKKAF